MDNFNWLPLLIIAVIVLAGQGRKLVAGARSPAAQAARQAYLQAAQAEAERAAAAAVPVRPAAPRPAVVPTPPRPLRAMMPPAGSAPTAALPAPPMHTFIRAAFADPAHARRAIVLAEILLPPPALR